MSFDVFGEGVLDDSQEQIALDQNQEGTHTLVFLVNNILL